MSLPCPWTGAEKVDGRAVRAADGAVVGAAVMVEMVDALTDEAPKLRSTANNVDDETLTPKRGEEDPPTLTPSKGAVPEVVAAALLALEVTTALPALEVMTELTALLAFETIAELLALDTTAALLTFEVTIAAVLLVFEVATATALLDLTTAAALLVLRALEVFAVVVAARSSRMGAAAAKALKKVMVARSFILIDTTERASKSSDRGSEKDAEED